MLAVNQREIVKWFPGSPATFHASTHHATFPFQGVPKATQNFPDLTTRLYQTDAFPCAIGEQSDLFRARGVNDEKGKVLALKTLRTGSSSNPTFFQELQQRLVALGDGWARLVHENIAPIYGVAYGCGRLPAIVMNYYPGSLISCMEQRHYSNEEKMNWVKEIASGMKYLHRQRLPVVHGDLRGSNIFLDATGRCQIADVGMVYLTHSPEFVAMQSAKTCRWTAPELMDPRAPTPTTPGPECTTRSDVFSFAMTVVEIFSENPPFKQNKNDTSVIFLIVKGERPELPQFVQESPILSKLIPACWAQEPFKRPTISYVCWKLGVTSNFRYVLEWVNLI
ncbi:kinase-like protein [Coprinellus micaceus]|uniref:Kinase-like protein n=1 Tax=Coprinellus micaceus TaxID=71717 RepID=A0A4Y7SPZ8_COPMI|nr:kinase-like protein [Coprinellus micaceus]